MTKTAYLFGEVHGSEAVCLKEFEIWNDFYSRGFRHLFLEIPYFEAQFLNLWIKSEDDSILDELWRDNKGTAGNSIFDRDFFIIIKLLCHETVFHGTDIGHAYDTTGERFLKTVFPDSEKYRLAADNIEQGRNYYKAWQENIDESYIEANREKSMAENFIREFDKVGCDVVGFYGEAHVFSEYVGNFGISENMCSLLKKHYCEEIKIVPELLKNLITPLSLTEIELNGKKYKAEYFGKVYTPFDESCEYIEIFRLKDTENDFSAFPKKENYIPEMLYPCSININDVFVINSLNNEKSVMVQIFICDGFSEEYGNMTTEINMEAK
ncbi:MAG: hypothetical protein IJO22_00320 [Oscillospiraceae bacterium]|nr:hypothetical protein [Oscillospiraceae bacterium]